MNERFYPPENGRFQKEYDLATTTRNEAAERLSKDDEPRDAIAMMRDWMGPPDRLAVGRALFEEAIAAEHRATVELIGRGIRSGIVRGHPRSKADVLAIVLAVLNEEAVAEIAAWPALDVERLALADWNTSDAGGDDGLTWDTASESLRNDYRDKARRQAAEYARLASADEDKAKVAKGIEDVLGGLDELMP